MQSLKQWSILIGDMRIHLEAEEVHQFMNPILRRFIVLGTPLILGILLITHPVISDQIGIFHSILPYVDWWVALHVILLPGFCLIGLAAFLLVEGIHGVAATISRVALAVFIIFYPTVDSLLGIGTGILVRYATGLTTSQQTAVEKIIDMLWQNPIIGIIGFLGSLGWIVAGLTASVALSRPSKFRPFVIILVLLAVIFSIWSELGPIGNLWWIGVITISLALGLVAKPHLPIGLLVLGSFLFGADHAPPFGPLGMACFFLAALQFEWIRQQSASATSELAPVTSFVPGSEPV